ncbi:MAG: hypothetical protein ACQEWW_14360 [Bacillota bacterium]
MIACFFGTKKWQMTDKTRLIFLKKTHNLCSSAAGDDVSSMMISRLAEGKDWLKKKCS